MKDDLRLQQTGGILSNALSHSETSALSVDTSIINFGFKC